MLLELILALTILFVGMAVIGIQLRTSVATGYENERLTQALMLAEAKLDQLDSGAINIDRELGADGVMEGDFGLTFPGYFWRFLIEPHDDIDEIFTVELEILCGPPEFDREPGDIEDAETVIRMYALRPSPPVLDLRRDFGFTDEQMEEVAAVLPPDLDPSELSPAFILELPPDQLLELMPMLMEMFGQGFGFSPQQIQQAMDSGLLDPSNLPTGSDGFQDVPSPGDLTGQGRGRGGGRGDSGGRGDRGEER